MNRPRILKGGFVHFEPGALEEQVIVFQYNPETLRRTIVPIDGRSELKETIKFTLTFDAADALEHADPIASSVGIYPALFALDRLAEPSKPSSGFFGDLFSWLFPKESSYTLLVWGAQRTVPVRVIELLVREEMFDVYLNPIRASIDVAVEVLSEADVKHSPKAIEALHAYQKKKESLASRYGSAGTVDDLIKI